MSDFVFDPAEKNFELKRKTSFSTLSKGSIPRVKGIPASTATRDANARLLEMMETHLPTNVESIQKSIVNHLEYTLARNNFNVEDQSMYRAAAYSIRDRLIALLNDSSKSFAKNDVKRCYYLSFEFLLGRAMQNALVNLDLEENYKQALMELGYKLELIYDYEHDAALGNGGLGRLAACFLDCAATINLPLWGYGIRYKYGIFEQKIRDGQQIEYPDYWLVQDNPWEIVRNDITYAVRFGGYVEDYLDENQNMRKHWVGGIVVEALAYDNPIPGFDTLNCVNLRLWKAVPSKEFDFDEFNAGNYFEAIKERQDAECITSVLYPNDNTPQGKELRFKQQYFFVCATIQDILRRFKKRSNGDWYKLPTKIAVQLNDTHPTIAIPELIRILVDVERMDWNDAVKVSYDVFGYTNHTVLPEALEKWSVTLVERILPRHLQIIYQLNHDHLNKVRSIYGDDHNIISKMSIFEEDGDKRLCMANLAIIGSHCVNGVAALHTKILKSVLFPEYVDFYSRLGNPNKFINITNGVTHRRWVHNSNRSLSNLISLTLGSDAWLKNFSLIQSLINYIDNEEFVKSLMNVRLSAKERLAQYIFDTLGLIVSTDMLFDVQIKRIHEYKRQHLNLFYNIHRYLTLKKMTPEQRTKVVPRCTIFAGKAAPGYKVAKDIIRWINCFAHTVNNDEEINNYLKIVFIPNYNVSSASIIIPAADLNQQISTAGMEASGTSNMKFVMNGSLIIGTLDGATVEILEECGEEAGFVFGALEHEIEQIRNNARNGNYPIDENLNLVFNWILEGNLVKNSAEGNEDACRMVNWLKNNGNGHCGDYYLLNNDFSSYIEAQNLVDRTYLEKKVWWRRAIKSMSNMSKFTADRSVLDYANYVWHIKPCEVQIEGIIEDAVK